MRQTWAPWNMLAQTSPAAPATTAGPSPVGIVSITLPVSPSIRLIVLPRSFGTHTSPSITSRLTGLIPTLTVATARRLTASIRVTEPSVVFETQTSLPLGAIHEEPSPPDFTRVSL